MDKAKLAGELGKAIDDVSKVAPIAKVGIALIGLGRSGKYFITSMRSLTTVVSLKWAIDIDTQEAQKVASEMKCKCDAKLDAALADPEVRIVIISSTTDTHFHFVMQSLRAGKAVFVEKPLACSIEEVQQAVNLAKELDLPLVCGYQRRTDKNFKVLKKQVDDGNIGVTKLIKVCLRDSPMPPLSFLRTCGGIFHDQVNPALDLCQWLSNEEPESITATGHCYHPEIQKMGDLDTVAVLVKYQSGLVAVVDTSRESMYGYDERIEAFGSRGMLTAKNHMTSTVEVATASGHLLPTAVWSFPERFDQAYTAELVEFVALVNAGQQSDAHKLEQQKMMRHPGVTRAAVAAELSWRLGKTVHLKELDSLLEQSMHERDAKKRKCE